MSAGHSHDLCDDGHQRTFAESEFRDIALLPEEGRGVGSPLVRDVLQAAGDRGVRLRLSVLVNTPRDASHEPFSFSFLHAFRARASGTPRRAADQEEVGGSLSDW
jgi:hypothetical protein